MLIKKSKDTVEVDATFHEVCDVALNAILSHVKGRKSPRKAIIEYDRLSAAFVIGIPSIRDSFPENLTAEVTEVEGQLGIVVSEPISMIMLADLLGAAAQTLGEKEGLNPEETISTKTKYALSMRKAIK